MDGILDTTGMYCPKCGEGDLKPLKDYAPSGAQRLRCPNGHRSNENTATDTPVLHREPRILLMDIETAPMLVYLWSLWQKFVAHDQIYRDWHILTWAARWMGDPSEKTMYDSMHLHESYRAWGQDDRAVAEAMWKLFDEADWIIGHNAERFDVKKMNARFALLKMKPPTPYKVIDTLKIAKSQFSFTSNKLDYLGEHLCGMKKIKTDHELWRRCLAGERLAWDEMLRYNIRDIDVLEAVYFEIRAWDKRHPNWMMWTNSEETLCNVCGSRDLSGTGKTVKTNVSEFVGRVCNGCGHQTRNRQNIRQSESKGGAKIMMNAL